MPMTSDVSILKDYNVNRGQRSRQVMSDDIHRSEQIHTSVGGA
jgi:hypothetical protein